MYKKRDDIYKHLTEGVETRLDTSNYELDRPILKRKNKKSNENTGEMNIKTI